MEHVIKVSHVCLNRSEPQLETKSEKYLEQVSGKKKIDSDEIVTHILSIIGSGAGEQ